MTYTIFNERRKRRRIEEFFPSLFCRIEFKINSIFEKLKNQVKKLSTSIYMFMYKYILFTFELTFKYEFSSFSFPHFLPLHKQIEKKIKHIRLISI